MPLPATYSRKRSGNASRTVAGRDRLQHNAGIATVELANDFVILLNDGRERRQPRINTACPGLGWVVGHDNKIKVSIAQQILDLAIRPQTVFEELIVYKRIRHKDWLSGPE